MKTITNGAYLPGAIRLIAVLVILLSINCSYASGQDLLKLKSGKEIKVTIVEENASVIKYREFEDPAGPVYSIARDKVETVKYKKGQASNQTTKVNNETKDAVDQASGQQGAETLTAGNRKIYLGGVAQSTRQIRLLMEDQPEALNMFESGKRMYAASNACPLLVMAVTFPAGMRMSEMTDQKEKLRLGIPVLCLDGALIVAGIIFGSKGKARLQKSVSLYNSSLNKPVHTSLRIGLQENGAGISLRF